MSCWHKGQAGIAVDVQHYFQLLGMAVWLAMVGVTAGVGSRRGGFQVHLLLVLLRQLWGIGLI
jgi:hypothetical protein